MSTLCTVARGGRLANRLLGPFLIGLLIVFLTAVVRAESWTQASQWPMGGHDLSNSGSQSFTTIGVSNVNQLTTKWVFTTAGSVSATPAVVHGVVYFPDWPPVDSNGQPIPGADGSFYAVDAATGQLIWEHKISDWTGVSGDFARDDPAFSRNKIILGDQGGQLATFSTSGLTGPGARVIEVNAEDGSVIWVTQVDKFPAARHVPESLRDYWRMHGPGTSNRR
jgi:polyvinyl alcohol dehydrogenase (cytochrome)